MREKGGGGGGGVKEEGSERERGQNEREGGGGRGKTERGREKVAKKWATSLTTYHNYYQKFAQVLR